MPYIEPSARKRLASYADPTPMTPGELTYVIQHAMANYLDLRGRLQPCGIRYEDLAVCLGALEGAKLDLIERVIKPYEEAKRVVNGDVWPEHLLRRHKP